MGWASAEWASRMNVAELTDPKSLRWRRPGHPPTCALQWKKKYATTRTIAGTPRIQPKTYLPMTISGCEKAGRNLVCRPREFSRIPPPTLVGDVPLSSKPQGESGRPVVIACLRRQSNLSRCLARQFSSAWRACQRASPRREGLFHSDLRCQSCDWSPAFASL